MRLLFREHHPVLGIVPGPARLARRDGVIWLAGGGRGESAVLRFASGVWRSLRVDAHGLRAVLPLDARSAVICGEHGYLALVHDDEIEVIDTDTDDCLFGLARAPDDTIWIGGDDGWLARLQRGDGAARCVDRGGPRLSRLVFGPDGALHLATSIGLLRRVNDSVVTIHKTPAPLTDLAFAPDGTLAVSGDAGELLIAAPGGQLARCAGVPRLDLEAIRYDARLDAFAVVGERGWTGVLQRDGTLVHGATAAPPLRLASVLPLDGGTLYAGWGEQGPPYRMRGALYLDGDGGGVDAPGAVAAAPRQPLPAPRVRSFAIAAPALSAADGIELSIDDARARLPGVSWPDTDCERVRFFDGDVHVADTAQLLADNNPGGYCVAVRGNLVVDGRACPRPAALPNGSAV